VSYYYEASDGSGGGGSVPGGGARTPFTFVVGELTELYCEDFEDDDGGYSHELLAGSDEGLADDWQWKEPSGTGGDPDAAYSGDNAWGNDLGGGNQDGQYEPSKTNRLTSIPIDVAGWDTVVVRFARWLSVEDGYYDHASFHADDELVWTNHESDSDGGEHTVDDRWMIVNTTVATSGDWLELGWELDSDQGLELGGWTIDDVCVYGLVAANGGDDTGSPPGDDVADSGDRVDDGDAPGGCGCGSTSPRAPVSLLAVAALAIARRRR
jgi:MYXO-CTERM domain-containing protein